MPKHKVGIVGATGYTGSELVRLLIDHPDVTIEIITSESKAGQSFASINPHFKGRVDMKLEPLKNLENHDLDLVFLALPHGVSMDFIREWDPGDFRVIDLSGDFRLGSAREYTRWYKKEHVAPDLIADAVFGLPELFRDQIRNAQLVANPGCYPTSAILALAPLLKDGIIEPGQIMIDAKSGVSGAGAKAKQQTHFPEVFGNFSAYGLLNHRHTPEIQYNLQQYSDKPTEVLFTPHLIPIDRGILTTTYSTPAKEIDKNYLGEWYYSFYEKEYFIRVVDYPPNLKHVRGSNYCDIHVTYDERTNKVVTVSTIDNLVKGAAGQAVQNMNLMFGFIERTGLEISPLSP
ncbi:N-acetyl-gamma-glutamyl-phosphate reductase [Fodinibius sp.]|uniref:N-acetyl-gamma-glutamyl-phosphate reductase n=1 Tax=Fodinibius sp. TaxID=1872440 RepID=UPI00356245AA